MKTVNPSSDAKASATTTGFCDRVLDLLRKERFVLFAGAGVGVHAGLPDWNGFVSHLISVAQRYEEDTATLMRSRATAGRLAAAASYYKICELIPEGEKYSQLAVPFHDDKYDSSRLDWLVKLPFEAIITTNFDRSLDNAWAAVHRKAPRTYELDDGSLRQAVYSQDFYISRIHGRASQPESMVVSTEDFAKLDSNSLYREFLVGNILTRHACLFVGFSFLDPAIAKILDLLETHIGPNYPKKHCALLPKSSVDLANRLSRFNIEVICYDSQGDLWACIKSLPLSLVEAKKPVEPPTPEPYPLSLQSMRVFLASCYVQWKDLQWRPRFAKQFCTASYCPSSKRAKLRASQWGK